MLVINISENSCVFCLPEKSYLLLSFVNQVSYCIYCMVLHCNVYIALLRTEVFADFRLLSLMFHPSLSCAGLHWVLSFTHHYLLCDEETPVCNSSDTSPAVCHLLSRFYLYPFILFQSS